MTDYINNRYVGMGSYDLQRYYDLLLIMREYYRADNNSAEGGSLSFILISVILVLFVLLFGWSILNKEWLVLLMVLGVAVAISWLMIKKGDKESDFESGFIAKVLDSGFTRADATEFLYDLDWDDIQYEKSHVEYILKDIEELKNEDRSEIIQKRKKKKKS